MKALQLFSDEALERGREMSPDQESAPTPV